ncbi:hypothetical protein HG530_004696 [Fusarium avenaceum]|nr:hypothetical protein HG530_004696 [Fusarium avenaceum]
MLRVLGHRRLVLCGIASERSSSRSSLPATAEEEKSGQTNETQSGDTAYNTTSDSTNVGRTAATVIVFVGICGGRRRSAIRCRRGIISGRGIPCGRCFVGAGGACLSQRVGKQEAGGSLSSRTIKQCEGIAIRCTNKKNVPADSVKVLEEIADGGR